MALRKKRSGKQARLRRNADRNWDRNLRRMTRVVKSESSSSSK